MGNGARAGAKQCESVREEKRNTDDLPILTRY